MTIEQYCGPNSGNVVYNPDPNYQFDQYQKLQLSNDPVSSPGFSFFEMSTFAGQYVNGIATGCKILTYTIT